MTSLTVSKGEINILLLLSVRNVWAGELVEFFGIFDFFLFDDRFVDYTRAIMKTRMLSIVKSW